MAGAFWTQLVGQLAVCHRNLRRHLAALASLEGLNDTEFLLLCGCLTSAGARSQHELAASIGLSPSQASGVFESLRNKELVSAAPGTRDRRCQTWQITEDGEQRVAAILRRLEPLLSIWEHGSSEHERQIVLDSLRRWSAVETLSVLPTGDPPTVARKEAA